MKSGRDDRIERRFLTRIEIVLGMRRLRADVRTSHWLPRLLTLLRPLVPTSMRGTRQEKQVRECIVGLVGRCGQANDEQQYEKHQSALRRLHAIAEASRLRVMSIEEIRDVIGEPMNETSSSGESDPGGL